MVGRLENVEFITFNEVERDMFAVGLFKLHWSIVVTWDPLAKMTRDLLRSVDEVRVKFEAESLISPVTLRSTSQMLNSSTSMRRSPDRLMGGKPEPHALMREWFLNGTNGPV